MMKKILVSVLSFFLASTTIAQASLRSDINNVIIKSGINRGSISVSVKHAYTGKTVYELNPRMPVSPASNMKILTATSAFLTLGADYQFSTKLYRNSKNIS